MPSDGGKRHEAEMETRPTEKLDSNGRRSKMPSWWAWPVQEKQSPDKECGLYFHKLWAVNSNTTKSFPGPVISLLNNDQVRAVGGWGPRGVPQRTPSLGSREFPFGKMKNVLALDGGDVCTMMGVYLMPLNVHLKKWLKGQILCVYLFYHNKKVSLKKRKERTSRDMPRHVPWVVWGRAAQRCDCLQAGQPWAQRGAFKCPFRSWAQGAPTFLLGHIFKQERWQKVNWAPTVSPETPGKIQPSLQSPLTNSSGRKDL